MNEILSIRMTKRGDEDMGGVWLSLPSTLEQFKAVLNELGMKEAVQRDILSGYLEAMNTYMMDFANKYEAGVPLDVETDTIDRMFQDTLTKAREQTQPETPPTPTVAELEAEVKAGNQISLTDLARAVKNEPKQPPARKEKPSILAQLRDLKQAAQTKDQNSPAPKRGNDLKM